MDSKAVGRPRKAIDWKLFDKMCYLHCTLVEIADFFECDVQTIEAIVKREQGQSFSQYVKSKRVLGKIDLRSWQFRAAKQGNSPVLLKLGECYLDQNLRPQGNPETEAPKIVVVDKYPDVE